MVGADLHLKEDVLTDARALTAQIEPFDSFWEAPEDIERGYGSFARFYRANYLRWLPENKEADILVVSCGPGYFLDLLRQEHYTSVLGIDSDASKIEHATRRNLPCQQVCAFDFMEETTRSFDVIFCEQEINHLTKNEILAFLDLCGKRLRERGRLIVHGLNGANPICGAEALAQNFDHYNTMTAYSMRQALESSGFVDVSVFPLHLYVFYANPLNYVAWGVSALANLCFRAFFVLYGKSNRIWTKKIGAVAFRSACGTPDRANKTEIR